MDRSTGPPWWLAVCLMAMAGGMGWGIRGQYGHQTGAMIAGLSVALAVVFLFLPHATSLTGARVVAFCALGISLGGSMTYGQTVGLTHDAPLIGNWHALGWGLLGLFIKGGIWIGLAGLFLGMVLGRVRYRPAELALLLLAALFLLFLGVQLLNEPFDPARRLLPKIYFSDDWYWEPEAELQPRRERWGGLLFALAAIALYARCLRRDRLAFRLACWGFVAGGVGFASGQAVQAFHAWNPQLFQHGWFAAYEPHINWWNMMEITFGTIFGAILATGVWLNRHLIDGQDAEEHVELTPVQELLLVLIHVGALVAWEFGHFLSIEFFADNALTMIVIPIVAVAAGRYWPYLFVLPIIAVPISGKTLRQLGYRTDQISAGVGWIVYVAFPLAVAIVAAMILARSAQRQTSRSFARWCLLLTTWLYFWLNFAFFEYPWPWQPWTGRTPSALIFTLCACTLTVAALVYGWKDDQADAASVASAERTSHEP